MRVTRCPALPRQVGEPRRGALAGLARMLVALFILAACALSLRPAWAVEDGLMGVRIGASYRELTRRLGPPDGILLGGGGSMIYQTLSRPQAGLPQFGGQAGPSEMPVWVSPVL